MVFRQTRYYLTASIELAIQSNIVGKVDGKIDVYSAFLSGDIQIEGNARKEILIKALK